MGLAAKYYALTVQVHTVTCIRQLGEHNFYLDACPDWWHCIRLDIDPECVDVPGNALAALRISILACPHEERRGA